MWNNNRGKLLFQLLKIEIWYLDMDHFYEVFRLWALSKMENNLLSNKLMIWLTLENFKAMTDNNEDNDDYEYVLGNYWLIYGSKHLNKVFYMFNDICGMVDDNISMHVS